MNEPLAQQLRDPRLYQLAVLAGLLAYGAVALDFEVQVAGAATIAGVALATQLACTRLWRLPRFEPRSALVSTLSLCLLLRTTSLSTAALAAAIAIASKFALRWRGKHVFNPTAFGIATVLALCDDAWVSAGQWGTTPILCLWVAGLGSLVIRRAERSDVTWAFLASYLGLLFGRAALLGDPIAIPLHAVGGGALLIFAFFMISDPRTTPDSRAGRSVFAALVACVALGIRFGLYHTNGLIWALVACAPLVPLIDRALPGRRHQWTEPGGARETATRHRGGTRDETSDALGPGLPGLGTAS